VTTAAILIEVRQDAIKEEPTVVDPAMDALTWLRKQLEIDCPDLVRAMLGRVAGELMGAEADAMCGAPYGELLQRRAEPGPLLQALTIGDWPHSTQDSGATKRRR
jgi:hypothetical protein